MKESIECASIECAFSHSCTHVFYRDSCRTTYSRDHPCLKESKKDYGRECKSNHLLIGPFSVVVVVMYLFKWCVKMNLQDSIIVTFKWLIFCWLYKGVCRGEEEKGSDSGKTRRKKDPYKSWMVQISKDLPSLFTKSVYRCDGPLSLSD